MTYYDESPRRDVPPAAADTTQLVALSSLDGASLGPDEPDLRGWDLLDGEGRRVGIVDELLVDPARDEVGALAVRAGDGLVVVPITTVHIGARERVVTTTLTPREFDALPRGASSAGDARAAHGTPRQRADAPTTAEGHPGVTVERTADGGEIVSVPVVEEQLVVERRPVVREVVVIRKRPVTEERIVEADLRRERIAVDGPAELDGPR